MDRLDALDKGVRGAFAKIKAELDDHLDGINRNAAEAQSLFEFLVELDGKLDKLHERLDSLELDVHGAVRPRAAVEGLSYREQEVFLSLYTAELPVTAVMVADRSGLSEGAVRRAVSQLVARGVPVLQQAQGADVLFSLELRFKDAQAKHNIVRIDERVSSQVV